MSNIKVAVRCRPLFEKERPATGLDFQGRRILLDSKTYDPDFIFPQNATQDDVFGVCQPILQSVKDGLHGTVMVYGQTGTGKTHTMLGGSDAHTGIAHRMIASMLEHVQQKTLGGSQCALTLSMIEIYNERLSDMLSANGSEEVTLVGGFPKSTTKVTLSRLSDAVTAIQRGLSLRHTAVTMMNERSSRSHVVIIVDFEEQNAFTESVDVAHLFLVDLAGSESLKKSQASGAAAGEAGKINKSLLALKSVFLALANSSESTRPGHVPYRDSKLTEILQDSIGGSARTLLVACISAVGRDIEETKSTLMYAVKARSIRNAANTEREKLMIRLRSFEVENQRLRNRLQERVVERGGYYVTREEHERLQAMEEESATLRRDNSELLRERQHFEARQHITASQSGILYALVEEKEEELQRFKQIYQDALQRFDAHIGSLQRAVHDAVDTARDAAQSGAEDISARLERWRAAALCATRAGPFAFTRDAEAALCRAVDRINATVSALLAGLRGAALEHCAAVRRLRARRTASRDSAAEAIAAAVRGAFAEWARDAEAAEDEAEENARRALAAAELAVAAPAPADAQTMRNAARDVCHAVVDGAAEAFPAPEISETLEIALRGIGDTFRARANAASLDGLLGLGNVASPRVSAADSGLGETSASAGGGLALAAKDGSVNTSAPSTGGKLKRLRSSGNAGDSQRVSSTRMEK